MDREKRRSEEHEAELDRRIALIREKNQQIEQRTKEIEEDRARNEDSTAKSPKPPTQTPPKATTPERANNGNGQWSREWDKGKTPAETWRENVPSMDLKGRLAGQQSNHGAPAPGAAKRGTHNNNNVSKGAARKEKEKVPSRLEGRVSFPHREKEEKEKGGNGGNGGRRGKDGGRGGHQNKEKEKEQKKDVEQERKKSTDEVQKGQRRRGGKPKEQPEVKEAKEKAEKKKKPRVRSESDNYAVKKVVHRMVDKICWMERMEKRKLANELIEEPEPEPKSDGEEQEDVKSLTEAPEVTEVPEDVKPSDEVATEAPEDTKPSEDVAPQAPDAPEDVKTPEDVASEAVEAPKEDTNQNVINLVRDKVVTMTTSQIL